MVYKSANPKGLHAGCAIIRILQIGRIRARITVNQKRTFECENAFFDVYLPNAKLPEIQVDQMRAFR